MNQRQRIAYDGRLAIEPFRGMGRYLRTLIGDRRDALMGFCAAGESSQSLPLIAEGVRFYPVWEQWSLPKQIEKFRVETFIAPYNTAPLRLGSNVRLVLIVHDLIFLEPAPLSRSLYQNVGRIYRRQVVSRAVPKAQMILTVSEYTKSQIVQRFRIAPERIRVIPCSLGAEWFDGENQHVRREHAIFTVSGEAPSKNLGRAIEAFARYLAFSGDRDIRFRIAGVRRKFHSAFLKQGERLGVRGQLELYGYLSDEAIRRLYITSEVFLLASISEGFGIPVLEAMASRTPVILSSGGSLPEVGGDSALYFNPYSVDEMACTLYDVLSNESKRDALSIAGSYRVLSFSESFVRPLIEDFWRSLDQVEDGQVK
jgi:glycosyltransferase involved in cell wall biosynthesis